MDEVRKGGCQCGAVRYQFEGDPLGLAVCHCEDCQCSTGSAFGMSLIVPERSFKLLTGSPKKYTKTATSGRPVDCLFCTECGVRVYHQAQYLKGTINIKPGTLDDRFWLEPTMHVWTGSKQPWVPIPEGTRTVEGQPL
jgi:hypothetical protein